MSLQKLDYIKSYARWAKLHKIKALLTGKNASRGLEQAIGGNFDSFSIVLTDLLVQHGLKKTDYLIDMGCGSGRLTRGVSRVLTEGQYLGVDIVPTFVAHAKKQTPFKHWKFLVSDGKSIPEKDGTADMVCFFSVFTHILHEHTYRYLAEAKRVLKPGGKIVFSFLDFRIPSYWAVFETMLGNQNSHAHLNMFISRDGIEAWSSHLGLQIVALEDGDKPHIPLSQRVVTERGTVMDKMGYLGQSVCVLQKPVTH